MASHKLGELSWTEVRETAKENPVVLLPMGAVEQHGPHLPIHEDSIVAEWVADRVSERCGCYVAPTLNYGHSGTFRGYPGNLSLSQSTLRNVTFELLEGLVASGFRRIVIVNNNGGNVGPVSGAALDARRDLGVLVGHLYPWQLGYALMKDVYDDPQTAYGHGAEPEHSAMLAMFPSQVRKVGSAESELTSKTGWIPTSYTEAKIPGYDIPGTVYWDFSEVSETGCAGDLRLGSAETGTIWIDRVIGFCESYVREYDKNTLAEEGARVNAV